jgi:dihydroneopterin aldolase
MIYKVKIDGLKIFAYHGVLQSEKDYGQDFYIDVHLDVEAGSEDRIDSTVSYATVADEVVRVATASKFDLIETLATEVSRAVLALDPRVLRTTITVHKPSAPIGHEMRDVSVTVSGARSEN